jgi:hypothetical protein
VYYSQLEKRYLFLQHLCKFSVRKTCSVLHGGVSLVYQKQNNMSISNPSKKFQLDVKAEYSGNCVGVITLVCIAYLYHDGTVRTVDIDQAFFGGNDVAGYVSAAQCDVWDEWMEQAEAHIKSQTEIQTPEEMAEFHLNELDNNIGTSMTGIKEI